MILILKILILVLGVSLAFVVNKYVPSYLDEPIDKVIEDIIDKETGIDIPINKELSGEDNINNVPNKEEDKT